MSEMTQTTSLTASQAHLLPIPSMVSTPGGGNDDEHGNAESLDPNTTLSNMEASIESTRNTQLGERTSGQSADATNDASPSPLMSMTVTTPTVHSTTVSPSSSSPPAQQLPSSGLLAPPASLGGGLTTLTSSALNSSTTLTGPLAPLSLPPSTLPSSTSLAAMINSSLGAEQQIGDSEMDGEEMQALNSGPVSTSTRLGGGPSIISPASATSPSTTTPASAPISQVAPLPTSAQLNSSAPASASQSASNQATAPAMPSTTTPALTSTVSFAPVTIPSLTSTPTPTAPLTLPEPPKPLVAITFLFISGKRRTMTFDPDTTIGRVKELLWSSWPSDVNEVDGTAQPPAPSYLRVLYLGKILLDEDTLSKLSFPTHIPEPNTTITPPPTIVHLSIRPSFPNNSSDDMTLKKKASRAVRRGLSRTTSTAVTGAGAGGGTGTGVGAITGGHGDRSGGGNATTGTGRSSGAGAGGAGGNGTDRRRMDDEENVTTCCSCVIG